MPVVPQVDVHRTCTFSNKHQEVHAQTDGNNQCSYCGIVSNSSSSGPTHVEHTELQVVQTRDFRQRITKIIGQQGGHNTESDKTDAHIES